MTYYKHSAAISNELPNKLVFTYIYKFICITLRGQIKGQSKDTTEMYPRKVILLISDLNIELLVESFVYLHSSIKHLIVGFRMLLYLRLYVFIIKDKTFDCGNQNIH